MQLIKAIIHISTINRGKTTNRIYKLHAKIDKLLQSTKKNMPMGNGQSNILVFQFSLCHLDLAQ